MLGSPGLLQNLWRNWCTYQTQSCWGQKGFLEQWSGDAAPSPGFRPAGHRAPEQSCSLTRSTADGPYPCRCHRASSSHQELTLSNAWKAHSDPGLKSSLERLSDVKSYPEKRKIRKVHAWGLVSFPSDALGTGRSREGHGARSWPWSLHLGLGWLYFGQSSVQSPGSVAQCFWGFQGSVCALGFRCVARRLGRNRHQCRLSGPRGKTPVDGRWLRQSAPLLLPLLAVPGKDLSSRLSPLTGMHFWPDRAVW